MNEHSSKNIGLQKKGLIRISIDLMGGENAPDCILRSVKKIDDVHFIFNCLDNQISAIEKCGISNYSIEICEKFLKDGDRYHNDDLRKSTLYSAINQVKIGNADCVVSGGPSGYYLLLVKMLLKTFGGINRPALAATIPTLKGRAIMLDLGANLECSSDDLVNFAILGTVLSKFWLDVKNPKVGFVNIGAELGKGPEFIRIAYERFDAMHDSVSFIEGHDIMNGEYDVIIVDGFTGNCMLKLGEGVMGYTKRMMARGFSQNILYKLIGLACKIILKSAIEDSRDFNGGIFAGAAGCAIKSHGSADEVSYTSALQIAKKIALKKDELLAAISAGFNHPETRL